MLIIAVAFVAFLVQWLYPLPYCCGPLLRWSNSSTHGFRPLSDRAGAVRFCPVPSAIEYPPAAIDDAPSEIFVQQMRWHHSQLPVMPHRPHLSANSR